MIKKIIYIIICFLTTVNITTYANEIENKNYKIVTIENRKGIIDKSGNYLIDPLYQNIEIFCNNYAIVKVFDQNYFLTNLNDDRIPIIRRAEYISKDIKRYEEKIYIPTINNGLYGLVKYNEKTKAIENLITNKYSKIEPIEHSLYYKILYNNKWALFDTKTEKITDFIFEDIRKTNKIEIKLDNEWYAIDKKNKIKNIAGEISKTGIAIIGAPVVIPAIIWWEIYSRKN